MEGEITRFFIVWISAIAALIYCYFVPFDLPKGKIRLLSLLPVIFFFTLLPLNLTTVSLGGTTAFFLTWLANFKLLLFSFGYGPLSSNPSISLSCFISIACLPIMLKTTKNKHHHHLPKSPLNLTLKAVVLALLGIVYEHKHHIHPKLVLAYYSCCIYIVLELLLATVAAMAGALLRLELDPQFEEPYLSTSLQDFWGRRWNLMVSNIMRPTVYEPVRLVSKRALGPKWAPLPAVLLTFLVSGLMHELIFFYIGRVAPPTWEVTGFFVVQGVCVVAEIEAKKALKGRLMRVHGLVSGGLAVGFIMVTSFWLFFPQMLRCGGDIRAAEEMAALVGFVKDLGRIVDPFIY